MTMTPDEVVKKMQERLSEAEKQRAEYVYSNKEVNEFIEIQKQAISLIQDYQKLRERVSVEKIQKILAWELSLLGKPMNDGSVPKLAQAIVTYLQQPTEH